MLSLGSDWAPTLYKPLRAHNRAKMWLLISRGSQSRPWETYIQAKDENDTSTQQQEKFKNKIQNELPIILNRALCNQEERRVASQNTSGNFSFHPNLELIEFFHIFLRWKRVIWIYWHHVP